MSTEPIDIYGGKASIKQNKFGVWQFRMWVSNENERAKALKEVKRLCKEFGFTAGMLKNSLAEGRKVKCDS